jgi:Chaperone of endosialidase
VLGVKGYGSKYGVYGEAFGNAEDLAYGVYGTATPVSNSNAYAGYFQGKVNVTGTFTHGSDRNAKANIAAIDPRTILQKLAAIPIQAWNYKTEPESVRHVGPMAQDFRAAFGLGIDDKTISTVDADGVALAAIQALYRMMKEKDEEVKQLRAQLRRQQAQLQQVRRRVSRARAARR